MINDEVIKEIYRKCSGRKVKSPDELRLPYYQELLSHANPIDVSDELVSIRNMDEYSPFKRFLIRSLNAVIEFERTVAFVFNNHIIFMSTEAEDVHIHFRPAKKKRFFGLFG